jgi:putative molybdopterin biosynthesis protein
MCPASSGHPGPADAYAAWLDSLARAGWEAVPRAERAPVGEALGRVTAAPVVARWSSPRSDCSAMDGIAVAAATLAALRASGRDEAGGGAAGGGAAGGGGSAVRLPAGSFTWVDTGDPMPDGADIVVLRESLLPQLDGSVVVTGLSGGLDQSASIAGVGSDAVADAPARGVFGIRPGRNVRRAGEDFAAGSVLVPAGRRLRPGDLAAAAAGGHPWLPVTRAPTVAIIPTGDEIRPVGTVARAGEILDTNSLMVAARCRQAGAAPVVRDVQPDDPDALTAELRLTALDADLVLLIAGSSRGRDDHAATVLAQAGGVAVAGVAVRPGHPALLGHAKRPDGGTAAVAGGITPVVVLPGYPLAAAVIFELFAAPLLAAIAGLGQPTWPPAGPRLLATLDRDWRSPAGIEDWVLVTLSPAAAPMASPTRPPAGSPASALAGTLPVATPARRGAGSISQLAQADAWWPIPADQVAFTAGAVIAVAALPDAFG